jgi:acyl-CoA-binding protein
MASRIPFPNRFYAAVGFAANPPLGARAVADETRLLLYALYQQATAGPCRAPKPWGWNAIESAKWSSWTQLGDTAAIDAMRMYVSTMEEENPDWFSLFTDGGDPARVAEVLEAAAEAVAAAGAESELAASREREREAAERLKRAEAVASRSHPAVDRIDAEEGAWTTLTKQIGGAHKPRGRYAHAMATVGDDVFVIGGNAGGRRLGDVFALHLPNLTWRRVEAKVAAEDGGDAPLASFPARSGHAAVSWGTKVVVVGGYHEDAAAAQGAAAAARARENAEAAAPKLDAWVLDTETSEWRRLALRGPAPPARGGHTATLVRGEAGAKIVVFGGEDRRGRLLDDVHVIDLADKSWVAPQIRGVAPAARAGHVAASFGGGSRAVTDVYVFGGVSAGAAGEVSGELFALDTMSMTWRELEPAGVPPVPRAGAAGAVVGEAWFIAGGGGAGGGRRDTVALRVEPSSGELEWTSAAEVDAGSSLAAEGAGVVAVGGGAALLAFGGYDGAKYSAEAHVLKRPAAGRLPMTKTKMLSPVKQKEWVSAAETEARRGERSPLGPSPVAGETKDASETEEEVEASPRAVARALAETRRALSEERSKSSRLEASLAETRLQLDRLMRKVGGGGSSATTSPRDAEPRSPSPPRRAKGVWGFLAGDAPEYRGANSSAPSA